MTAAGRGAPRRSRSAAACPSEQRVERQERKQADLPALPARDRRLLVEVHGLAVLRGAPQELGAPVGLVEDEDVAIRRLRDVAHALRDLPRELGTLDDEPDLRIEAERALVEVHRADEEALPVE